MSSISLTRPSRVETGVVRILIVDDHPLVRKGLRQLIADQPGWEVCDDADSVLEALHVVRTAQPHLVLIDISLRDASGMELIKEIKVCSPACRMLVLSNHDESLYAERALRAGASGYVNKHEAGEQLVDAIRHVLDGKVYLSSQMTDRMLSRALGSSEDEDRPLIETLTDRELEVFELIGRGLTTRQVAGKLNLSPKTVESYRESIKGKLHLTNSTELMREAVQRVLEGT
jgi:DNA-binding NarL/FixJ family response regulator